MWVNIDVWQFVLYSLVFFVLGTLAGVAIGLWFAKHIDKEFMEKLRQYRKKKLQNAADKI
jgi:membrane protein YqaA with SNARE-associated domain